MSNIEQVTNLLKTSLADTIQGQYAGGCQEWITMIATADQPENKKEEVILECLNNLSQQFTLTMGGEAPGDLTLWQQQLLQTMQNADYLSQ